MKLIDLNFTSFWFRLVTYVRVTHVMSVTTVTGGLDVTKCYICINEFMSGRSSVEKVRGKLCEDSIFDVTYITALHTEL